MVTFDGSLCCACGWWCSDALSLAVRRVVGLENFFLDPSSRTHVHALRLSPGTNLRDVIPSAAAASAPPVSPAASYRLYLSLHLAAICDVGLKCFVESLGILVCQINLVFLAVDPEADGLCCFRSIQVVSQDDALCHGFPPPVCLLFAGV
jgi:hypothetical protein